MAAVPDLTKKDVVKFVEDYDDLLARALEVVSASPHYSGVDAGDLPYLSLDKDEVVMQWRTYESDYYGGGYNKTEETRFPLDVLLMTEVELKAMQKAVAAEEKARERKLQAAQEAVRRDRQEAHDRAEYERLKEKYESQQAKGALSNV